MLNEQLAFGIDLGIGSCGWAVLSYPSPQEDIGTIKGLGSWCFDVPEAGKERTPTNQIRRGNRLLRRVIRRRRNRMAEIRRLFHARGLLATAACDALKRSGLDPWEMRARGLDKPLKPVEFAVALGHIAKRRGFKSAAKRKNQNAAGDDKKMLAALQATRERLGRYRTVGEMFARDPDFAGRRRNRDGRYDRTAAREDLVREVEKLFAAQRRLGQDFASEELEEAFAEIAFRQLPMQDSERLVGFCQFEKDKKRAARFSPSFERFRLLTRLVNLRVMTSEGERSLTRAELARVTEDLGKTAKLSVKRVRGLIGLPDGQRFTTIKPEEEDRDIAVRTSEAMAGTYALRKALGEGLWATMLGRSEELDAVSHVLSFFETNEKIIAELDRIGLEKPVLDALLVGLDDGAFAKFRGAANISAKAARKLLPFLEQGDRYDEACAKAGYDHAASGLSGRDQITNKAQFNKLVEELGESIANPVARKAMTEGLKQLWALRNRWGLPGAIHIELARDVGNSAEKRRELEQTIKDNTEQRERERDEVREILKIVDVDGETLLRYRLWKEQAGKCPYTGEDIHIRQVVATDNSVQIDHILPWSRFGDNSFNNKTLCLASANQRKKGDTPYEWFLRDESEEEWETFVRRIETNKMFRGFKKRNFLLKNAKEREEKFRSRNLNDTRYAARLLADAVKLFYPPGERQEKGGNRRVFTRPGQLTAVLRQAWGVESLKKVDGKRVNDDRHHALDALVVAAVSEREVQKLTKSIQQREQQGLGRQLRYVDPPWPGFRNDVLAAYRTAFVARPERRRARGKGHEAEIRQIVERGGDEKTSERIAVLELGMDRKKFSEDKALKQLANIKDPERNVKVVEAVTAWIAAGRPKDEASLPRSPAGDLITKVRLMSSIKPAMRVRGGTAKRGEMVRVDVFSMPNRKGKDEWYLVPVYPHQVIDKKKYPVPPNQYVTAHKDECEWDYITPAHGFRFSIYPQSYIEVSKPKSGGVVAGYFAGLDRDGGQISITSHNDKTDVTRRIGTRNLISIRKFSVDRFGVRSEVKNEARTWHEYHVDRFGVQSKKKGEVYTWRGAAFISPGPRD